MLRKNLLVSLLRRLLPPGYEIVVATDDMAVTGGAEFAWAYGWNARGVAMRGVGPHS